VFSAIILSANWEPLQSTCAKLLISFVGTFEGRVFEEAELEFCVQENEVISALNLVLPLMNFGEKCEITADPDFAYGKNLASHLVPLTRRILS